MKRTIVFAAAASALVATLTLRAGADTTSGTDPFSIGTGERLMLVVAGDYITYDAAVVAGTQFSFGELQGFYTAQSGWFEGLVPGRWMLVSAFRTREGADEFAEIARAAGVTDLREIVVRYLGTQYIGLGQEANPDGTGPLTAPLPDDSPYAL